MAVGWDLPAESLKADLTHHTRSASADVPGFYKVGQSSLSSVKAGETEARKVSLGQNPKPRAGSPGCGATLCGFIPAPVSSSRDGSHGQGVLWIYRAASVSLSSLPAPGYSAVNPRQEQALLCVFCSLWDHE